ncbi:3'(2')5'-bisphosphate nucleotidase CysQ, partial [Dissostichus eleginoides]
MVSRLWKPENQGETQRLSTVDRGVAGVGGAGKLHSAAEAWFMCSVGSQAGVLALNLALLQTSLLWRSAVPTAKQSREGRNVLNSTPVPNTEWGSRQLKPWFELVFAPLLGVLISSTEPCGARESCGVSEEFSVSEVSEPRLFDSTPLRLGEFPLQFPSAEPTLGKESHARKIYVD